MLKRQRDGDVMSDPVRMEAGIQMLTEACPDQPARTWDLLRTVQATLCYLPIQVPQFDSWPSLTIESPEPKCTAGVLFQMGADVFLK